MTDKIQPGPKSQDLIQRDEAILSTSYTRDYPLAVDRAQGLDVWDMDGQQYLDFSAGIAVCATGHCHPEVVKAIQDQAAKLIHICGADFYYPTQTELAEKLIQHAPFKGDKRVIFSNSGTEAVEAAFKLARYSTGRQKVVAFLGAFHGRSLGSLSLTASKAVQRKHFGPLIPGVVHVPYSNCYRCPHDGNPKTCPIDHMEPLKKLFKTILPAEEVAAVFVEPIQGEGGYIVPPPEFLQSLRQLCDEHGILMIADEIQSGIGRTGRMFAIEHFDVEPDIVLSAKGLASGMPLGAVIARADIMNWPPGSHASTFGGNPVSCAAALATIKLIEEGLMQNAASQGETLIAALKNMQSNYECMGDVRGKGLMVGVEIVKDKNSKEPDADLRNRICQKAFEQGLILLGCGANSIRFCPPLTINDEQLKQGLAIFEQSIKGALS